VNINLVNTGKKYYNEWIFRNTNIDFVPAQKTVILGPNGSGKSTLLQVVAGAVLPTEGTVVYKEGNSIISPDEVYNKTAFSSPYLELIEEFTLEEVINFHFKFLEPINKLTSKEILEATGLEKRSGQTLKFFSSGMKQKVKLTLAILSNTPVLLLDEPCSNLDENGVEWYSKMILKYCNERIVVVASNQNKDEYSFCTRSLNMKDFKQ
jgi:ABC-type multidrug transport system ATPase subunit